MAKIFFKFLQQTRCTFNTFVVKFIRIFLSFGMQAARKELESQVLKEFGFALKHENSTEIEANMKNCFEELKRMNEQLKADLEKETNEKNELNEHIVFAEQNYDAEVSNLHEKFENELEHLSEVLSAKYKLKIENAFKNAKRMENRYNDTKKQLGELAADALLGSEIHIMKNCPTNDDFFQEYHSSNEVYETLEKKIFELQKLLDID